MWKRWSLGALPMIPPKFGIKLIADRGIEQQFNVIKSLIAQADEVINCGDAGQEGELIQRWVMQKAGIKCPVKRLWISSLTDESIRKGFQSLEPEKKFENLYLAGLSRAIGDWVLGMNATRLYTLKYSNGRGNVLSVGRVQTPTLALIVERHFQIVNFKPEDYWELKTNYRDVTFNATSGKFKKIEDAQAALQQIQSKPFTVDTVTQKQGREAPLRLFDLTSLQVECNKRWGWTADETLKLIQILYEKKVTTYPRVDTTYLSTDIYPKVPDILSRMAPYANVTAPVLAKKIPMSKKIFDNSKVTDHHAIIPTGESPLSLVGDEKKMYHLIAMRFIAAFYPDCIFSTTTVLGSVEKIGFKAVGKVIVDPGWRALFAKDNDKTDDKDSENDDNRILPPFVEGETGPHTPALNKKTTQPPKLYTEGTLLRAMETAGKNVEEEELREAMKENGIGRPSTRSAIIETLFKRRYIKRERKNIVATQAGIDLIATIHEELLKSAKLTGLWENKLRRIERGDYSAAEFLTELKTMVSQIVYNVLNDNSGFQINVEQPAAKSAKPKKEAKPRAPRKKKVTDLAKIKCPKCGKGHIIKGRTAYGCSNYAKGCDMLLPFAQYSADLTPQELYDKLNEK
jgi:DNA topoisomerase-3